MHINMQRNRQIATERESDRGGWMSRNKQTERKVNHCKYAITTAIKEAMNLTVRV